jgi:hypothetical protein
VPQPSNSRIGIALYLTAPFAAHYALHNTAAARLTGSLPKDLGKDSRLAAQLRRGSSLVYIMMRH